MIHQIGKGKRMKKLIVGLLILANLLFWFGLVSCSFSGSDDYLPLPDLQLNTMQLFISADTRGNLEPCGCRSGQMGGLPRQTQYIMQNHKPEDWVVDLGNSMSATVDTYELFKWYYVLLVYGKAGYDAINLGQNEIRLPGAEIVQLYKKVAVPLVSANVLNNNGTPLVLPYVVASNKNVKLAITGIVAPTSQVGKDIVVVDPGEALAKYLPQMMKESHLLVVLANIPEEQAKDLSRRFPEIALLLNTGTASTSTPHKVGPVVISSLTEQGRFIQKLQFRFQTTGELGWLEASNIRLGNDIADHSGTVHLLNRYRQDLAEKRFYIQSLRTSEEYVGASRCAMCHNTIYASWKKTTHSHSLDSLKLKNNQHDPQCLKCHVTGFGFASGYIGETETPDKARIGCEVCHGPSARHALHKGDPTSQPPPGNAHPKQVCLDCHTWEHCEGFEYDSFWAKIAHSK